MRDKEKKRKIDITPANNVQSVILGVLAIAIIVTFITGAIKGRTVSAKNSEDYKTWQSESIKEQERISNLNVYGKINEGRDISLLVLGDGISQNFGEGLEETPWIDKLESSINEIYDSNVSITNLSQKGNNIYDGFNQYIALNKKEFDMVILCFDKYKEQQFTDDNFKGIFEALVRSIKDNNPNGDIIVVAQHGVSKDSKTFNAIDMLAKNYGLDIAEVNQAFKESDEELVSNNTLYPTDAGYNKYFEIVKTIIDNNVESDKVIVNNVKALYEKSDIFKNQSLNSSPLNMSGFSKKENNVIGNAKDSFVEYEATGSVVGLKFIEGPKSGNIEVYVNNALYKKIDTKSDNEKISTVIISDELSGTNTIKIVNTENKPVQILGVISSEKEE